MIRLNSITVQAFRGIREPITFDLSAPFTLLYAPNGSGKTSLCEAAEWLLTGKIKRLEASSFQDGIRCHFAPDSMDTFVSANMEVDGEPVCLERTAASSRWRIGDGKWRRVAEADLLEKLAPSAVQEGVHRRHANASRQIWLRGTRFLSGETLTTLLDSDGDSLSGRQRLFADLLGVGHLLETERQLDGYEAEIGQYLRAQQSLLDAKDEHIRSRETKVGSQLEDDRQDRLAAAIEQIRIAFDLLDLPIQATTESNVNSTIAVLRADLEGKKARWNQRRQAELRIAADWPQRAALVEALGADQARLAVLATEENASNLMLANADIDRQARAAEVSKAREIVAETERRERALLASHAQMVPALQNYLSLVKDYELTIEAADTMCQQEIDEAHRAAQVQRLRGLLAELGDVAARRAELPLRKQQYDDAMFNAPSAEAIAEVQKTSTEAEEHLGAARVAYERAAGPIQQLQHLALTVANELGHDVTTCPVCSFDWKSPDALRSALSQTGQQAPQSLVRLAQILRGCEEEKKRLEDLLRQHNLLLVRSVEASRAYRVLEQAEAAFASRVRDAGLVNAELTELQSNIHQAVARISLVAVLRVHLAAVRDVEVHLSMELPSPMRLVDACTVLQPLLADASARESGSLRVSEAGYAASNELRTAVAGGLAKIRSEREAIHVRLQQNGRRVQVLQNAWQSLAGDRAWSDSALADVSADLRTEYEDHGSVERVLVQAETLLREWSVARELEVLRAERIPLLSELGRLTKYSEAAKTIRGAYVERRRRHVKQQMQEFVRVISALFTRMQSNFVYDNVSSGDDAAPLSWRAMAENFSLDPETTFSQGQRQDFALAIFLARARGLGGTFVLDEPVAHLDDLNRVALLDVFRAIAVENSSGLSFVLTTANKSLVRHIVEKFARVASPIIGDQARPLLNLIEIEGNPRTGINLIVDSIPHRAGVSSQI